jgi:hypothetical protein
MWNRFPEDDKHYLVCWFDRSTGKCSAPHKAYWLEAEGHFFSLENNNCHPLHVDVWHEMPELPEIDGE